MLSGLCRFLTSILAWVPDQNKRRSIEANMYKIKHDAMQIYEELEVYLHALLNRRTK